MPKAMISIKFLSSALCPAGKARIDYFDEEIPGFLVEVRATGGKTFYLRYRDQRGRQKQFKIGNADVIPVANARKQAQKLLVDIALGEDPLGKRETLRRIPTFGEFVADRYLPFAKVQKKSWRADDSYLRNHLLPQFGGKPLDLIAKQEIIDWHHKNRRSHLAVATTNRLLVLLRYIYNLALKWEIPGVLKNPTAGIPMFEVDNRRERYLSPEEVRRLCATASESPNAMMAYIVPMLILTGARKHEVLEAKWCDVDLQRRFWRIPISKAGRARYVPLSGSTIALLNAVPRIDGCPFVFPNPETRQPYALSYGAWKTVRRRAGMAEVRMHDLRHTFASLLVNSGRSLYEVQQILGHQNIRMTQRYAHLSQETLLTAADAAADAAGLSTVRSSAR